MNRQSMTPELPITFSRHGHSYNNTTVSGHSRAHFGDVYNYHNSDSAQKALLEWLSPINPSYSHNQACKQYLTHTLRWFFEDRGFQRWCHNHDDTSPQTLWCRGGPGTGKTTLTAQILCHLQDRAIPSGDIAIVYCRYAERGSQDIENIAGSILAQLFQNAERGFDIPSNIETASKNQPWFWSRRPTLADLKDWMSDRLRASRPVYILVDALDELDARTRQGLLACLRTTLLDHSAVRLLVTSRDIPEDATAPSKVQIVKIFAHQDDLQAVVDHGLQSEGIEAFQRSILGNPTHDSRLTALRETVASRVVSAAGEMYAAP